MNVPFLDLQAHHAPLRDEITAAMEEVIDCNAFAGGRFVEQFEREFAAYCGAPHGIGVGSGTEALWVILLALGVGPGDEVITVPNTFIATAEAISFAGATPVFVDVDPVTYTLDPALIEAAITPCTRALIPVHLFGQAADMDPILAIADAHGIPVIEDAAQAHGATYQGRPVGSLGRAAAYSFYPGKNLGAWGEAGAVVTRDPELDRKIRILRDHGQPQKYHHDVVGWNCRMDGLQAVVLSVKLRHLDQATEGRRRAARAYDEALTGLDDIVCPVEREGHKHVYHVYALRSRNRDALKDHLTEAGIGTGIHYPIPLHLQTAYRNLGYGAGSFPVAEAAAAEFLSLPLFPELTPDQIRRVVDAIQAFTPSALAAG